MAGVAQLLIPGHASRRQDGPGRATCGPLQPIRRRNLLRGLESEVSKDLSKVSWGGRRFREQGKDISLIYFGQISDVTAEGLREISSLQEAALYCTGIRYLFPCLNSCYLTLSPRDSLQNMRRYRPSGV